MTRVWFGRFSLLTCNRILLHNTINLIGKKYLLFSLEFINDKYKWEKEKYLKL